MVEHLMQQIPMRQWRETPTAQQASQRRGEPLLHWSARLATQYLNHWYDNEPTQPDIEHLQQDVHLQFRFIEGLQLRWLQQQLLEEYTHQFFTYDKLKDRALSLHQNFEGPTNRQCRFRYGIPKDEDTYRDYFIHLYDANCSVGNPVYYKRYNLANIPTKIGLTLDQGRIQSDLGTRFRSKQTPIVDNNNNQTSGSEPGSNNNNTTNIKTEIVPPNEVTTEESNPIGTENTTVNPRKRKYSPEWIEQQMQIVDDVFNHYLKTTNPKKE